MTIAVTPAVVPPLRMPEDAGPFHPVSSPLKDGVTLIEASAGTGKTFSIVFIVLRLLLEREGGDIGRLLVVTFTNAATDELVTRIREGLRRAVAVFAGEAPRTPELETWFRLRDEYRDPEHLRRLRDGLAGIDRLSVFTIHGFCKRVLEESALESGTPYGADFVEDARDLLELAALDWWRGTFYENPRLAALAVVEEWTPGGWIPLLERWRRHPHTTLVPAPEPAGTACDALDGVCKAVLSAWDDARVSAALGPVIWKSKAPLGSEPLPLIREAVAGLARGELDALAVLRHCTPAMLQEFGNRQRSVSKQAVAAALDDPFLAACAAVDDAIARVERALIADFLADVSERFEQEKLRRQALGFDDLLSRLHGAMEHEGAAGPLAAAIRARYDAALIDEFQDTDPYQFPIFARAFRDRPLFLIGDPKQAIYGFRGADIFAYADAVRAADRRHTLPQNWRSTNGLVSAVNELFARGQRAFLRPEDEIGFQRAEAARKGACPLQDRREPFQWWFVPGVGDDACGKGVARRRLQRRTAAEIVQLIESCQLDDGGSMRPVRPGDIAVLVRSHREAAAVQHALHEAAVPSIVAATGDILAAPETRELEQVLRAIAAPHEAESVRAALATELWGWSAERIAEITGEQGDADWARHLERLAGEREVWVRDGFMQVVQRWLTAEDVAARMLRLADGPRRMTNLRHAVELLHAAAEEHRLSPEGLLAWLARERSTPPAGESRRELRLESDAEAVQIVTIHKSKGLEYGIVFCHCLWDPKGGEDEPVVVHEDSGLVLDLGSEEFAERKRRAESERRAEELRLAYVALTRARWRCYVGWGFITDAPRSPLAWLLRGDTEAPAGATCENLIDAAVSGLGEGPAWHQAIHEFVGRHPALMACEVLEADPAPRRWAPPAAAAPAALRAREFGASRQLVRRGFASFTSFVRWSVPGEDGREVADPGLEAEPAAAPAGIFALLKGRRAGDLIHAVFERTDLRTADAASVRDLAVELLRRDPGVAGELTPDAAADAIAAMVLEVGATPLPGAGFRLADVPRGATLREWPFVLPLAPVSGRTLARQFHAHAGDALRGYADRLARLAPREVQGFLTGVVDFAFTHDDRWYVLDWKSNHLGDTAADYHEAAVREAMLEHDYVLQYHLYLLALHRHLTARLPGYTYERHIGGAWYAFVRGNGWWFDRPPFALIDALDRALVVPAMATPASEAVR